MSKKRQTPRVLQHIICEDIRQEQHNKVTLVGCFGHSILIRGARGFPVVLPKLCFFFRMDNIAAALPFELTVCPPQEKQRAEPMLDVKGKLKPAKKGEFSQLLLGFSPFPLTAEGKYKGRLAVRGARAYNFTFEVARQKTSKNSRRK